MDWQAFMKAAQEVEKDYLRELEKSKKLAAELELFKKDYAILQQKYSEEAIKRNDLQAKLKAQEGLKGQTPNLSSRSQPSDSDEYQKRLLELYEECERFKSLYPLSDLMRAKELEVSRLKETLKLVPLGHADRGAAETMVKDHLEELGQLKLMVLDAEKRLRNYQEKIRNSVQNTQSKAPPSKGSPSIKKGPPKTRVQAPEY